MSDLFTGLWVRVSNALYREQGQAVTEYAIVLALVALIAAALVGSGIGTDIVNKVKAAIAGN